MHIEINDNTSLLEIQKVFNDYYPYLQIAFYGKPHKKYEASAESDRIPPGTTVGKIKKTHISAVLEILPLNKVAELEFEFEQRFGLSVQVLKKENEGWEQTSGMDDFTLKELNEMGRYSSDESILNDFDEDLDEETL
jgi:hypothetical protein